MRRLMSLTQAQEKARSELSGKKPKKSLKMKAKIYGLNHGLISNIISGKRRASRAVLNKMGIPFQDVTTVACCKRCGQVHLCKSCTRKITFEERLDINANWLKNHMEKLDGIVSWAESKHTDQPDK